MTSIVKIEYVDDRRRLKLEKEKVEKGEFVFAHFVTHVRDIFQFPVLSPLHFTYTDEDKDVVSMCNDQDFKDALIEQGLSPLRINVTLPKVSTVESSESDKPLVGDSSDDDSNRLKRPPSTPEKYANQKAQIEEAKAEAWAKAIREILEFGLKISINMIQDFKKLSLDTLTLKCGQKPGPKDEEVVEVQVVEEQNVVVEEQEVVVEEEA